jgi:hypothetical protein
MLSIVRKTTPFIRRTIPMQIRYMSSKKENNSISRIIENADVQDFKKYCLNNPKRDEFRIKSKVDDEIKKTKESRGFSIVGAFTLTTASCVAIFTCDIPAVLLKMININQICAPAFMSCGIASVLYLPFMRSKKIEDNLDEKLNRLYEIEDDIISKKD